ncbi:MAG: SphA family protein [Giesbergeria sp.]
MNTHTLAVIAIATATLAAPPSQAGEGGTSHPVPGSMSALIDAVPVTGPGLFVKPMVMNYRGEAKALIPTAAGVVANLEATVNTLAVVGGYTFGEKLFGATYTAVAALPYSFMDVSANAQLPGGGTRRISNNVSGFGDLTVIPVMLGWKDADSPWQFNALLPIYAPTGSYELGRLGNPGLNYWTFDPIVGVAYNNAQNGFNAVLNTGYAINTTNSATDYKSGEMLHFDGSVQQILPVGNGLLTLGLEGFYFQQTSCDSGAGATLGCFKGKTAGLGPAVGYILPLSKTETLVLEAKWLAEIDVEKRLKGDFIWLKAVYKF